MCWILWLWGSTTLGTNLLKRAEELRKNANDAEQELKFQAALLRQAESNRAGDISGSVVGSISDSVINLGNTTTTILERGGERNLWATPLGAIVLGVVANLITHFFFT